MRSEIKKRICKHQYAHGVMDGTVYNEWQKLRTRDKLKRWGCVESDVCVLCNSEVENIEHLFFDCHVLKRVFGKAIQNCLMNRGVYSWMRECSWFSKKTKGKSMLAKIRRVVFCCTVYNIRKARNRVIFQNERVDTEMIYYWIRQEVLLKLFSFRCNSTSFLSLYQKWQVSSLSD
ncbi:uncharacterized protein LOC126681973 [Mercurialis annua]|uniref:uncharacterized protein LOC126681973 n=1 Tax=Mercurialis annua TaxID=3986 RepID=UPI00215F579D|nr:uncharacterized protein LOC126681973 [Mercurialis annua]